MQGFEQRVVGETGTLGASLSVYHTVDCPADYFGTELLLTQLPTMSVPDSVLFNITGNKISKCYLFIDLYYGYYCFYCKGRSGGQDIEVFDDRLAYGGSISLDFARWTSNSDRISISFQATNTTYSEFLKMIGK